MKPLAATNQRHLRSRSYPSLAQLVPIVMVIGFHRRLDGSHYNTLIGRCSECVLENELFKAQSEWLELPVMVEQRRRYRRGPWSRFERVAE